MSVTQQPLIKISLALLYNLGNVPLPPLPTPEPPVTSRESCPFPLLLRTPCDAPAILLRPTILREAAYGNESGHNKNTIMPPPTIIVGTCGGPVFVTPPAAPTRRTPGSPAGGARGKGEGVLRGHEHTRAGREDGVPLPLQLLRLGTSLLICRVGWLLGACFGRDKELGLGASGGDGRRPG